MPGNRCWWDLLKSTMDIFLRDRRPWRHKRKLHTLGRFLELCIRTRFRQLDRRLHCSFRLGSWTYRLLWSSHRYLSCMRYIRWRLMLRFWWTLWLRCILGRRFVHMLWGFRKGFQSTVLTREQKPYILRIHSLRD